MTTRHFGRCAALLPVLWLALAACSDDNNNNNMQAGPVQGAGAGGTDGTAGMGTAGTGTAGTAAGAGTPAAGAGGGAAAGQGAMAGAGAGAGQGGEGGTGAAGTGAGAGGNGGAAAGAGGSDGSAGTEALPPLPEDVALPIVFVHGFAGSAQQYQSQAMRFVANGYPIERIFAYDHDGAGFDAASIAGYVEGLDAVIDGALAEFGVEQVYLVGHSRGTFVSSSYLGNASRAAKVAKYIAIDGSACPGGSVPCIAPSQAMFPGQAHVEVATSAESFEMQYEFLIGEPPEVVEIVRQRAPVEISGRAVNFPANTGRAGVTLQIWEIESDTGARATSEPLASFEIGADGDWGPVTVDPETHYEFVLVPEPPASHHHFYMQPFLRSTRFVRLLSGPPDSETRANTNTGDGHSTLVVSRMREWMASMDVLEISSSGPAGTQEPVDVMTDGVGNDNIAVHVHDDAASPGESSLDPLPYFSAQPFQYGVDVYMPASDPPEGTITLRNLPRGDSARPQVLNVPNWPSSGHAISILFSDFAQD